MCTMDWIKVSEKLPPDNNRHYPIVDSDGCGDFIYGSVIRSDYEDSKICTDNSYVRIKMWIDAPLPLSHELHT